jgi:hypothetical protein
MGIKSTLDFPIRGYYGVAGRDVVKRAPRALLGAHAGRTNLPSGIVRDEKPKRNSACKRVGYFCFSKPLERRS